MAAELERWRRRYAAHVVAAAKAAVAALLKAKDEEIERTRWFNWLLQEQARAVHSEAQAWRDAAAAVLRADLDRALRGRAEAEATAAADDAESCCYGDNGGGDDTAAGGGECEPATDTDRRGGKCHGCGERTAAALLLPCRHLSACTPCAAAAWACPACGRHKVGVVAVNPVYRIREVGVGFLLDSTELPLTLFMGPAHGS